VGENAAGVGGPNVGFNVKAGVAVTLVEVGDRVGAIVGDGVGDAVTLDALGMFDGAFVTRGHRHVLTVPPVQIQRDDWLRHVVDEVPSAPVHNAQRSAVGDGVVGEGDGDAFGDTVGDKVGMYEGCQVGALVSVKEGELDGEDVNVVDEGLLVGAVDDAKVGDNVGDNDGTRLGAEDGKKDGACKGELVGVREGALVGARVGECVGEAVGE
jgi:hypothetical protein